MDEEFRFLSFIVVGVQLVLFGTPVTKDIVAESHIMHSGQLLCKESQEALRNRVKQKYEAKTIKDKYSKVRPTSSVCPECQRLYKMNGHSAYQRWVEGKPKTPTVAPIK